MERIPPIQFRADEIWYEIQTLAAENKMRPNQFVKAKFFEAMGWANGTDNVTAEIKPKISQYTESIPLTDLDAKNKSYDKLLKSFKY